uniref:Calponin-homology (CH) domain-containing protein n=1 Tax=Biomphalaria glabrata TaxID=6526 RepID=A0A2C9LNI7_BIOGL
MKNFKAKKLEKEKYPEPEACILEIVNSQLKKTNEGKRIFCSCLDDLVDSRILCALLNSFVPDTFITKLLLNDRWTVNLVLKTAEKMFYIDTPFDSEDLVED